MAKLKLDFSKTKGFLIETTNDWAIITIIVLMPIIILGFILCKSNF